MPGGEKRRTWADETSIEEHESDAGEDRQGRKEGPAKEVQGYYFSLIWHPVKDETCSQKQQSKKLLSAF